MIVLVIICKNEDLKIYLIVIINCNGGSGL